MLYGKSPKAPKYANAESALYFELGKVKRNNTAKKLYYGSSNHEI